MQGRAGCPGSVLSLVLPCQHLPPPQSGVRGPRSPRSRCHRSRRALQVAAAARASGLAPIKSPPKCLNYRLVFNFPRGVG